MTFLKIFIRKPFSNNIKALSTRSLSKIEIKNTAKSQTIAQLEVKHKFTTAVILSVLLYIGLMKFRNFVLYTCTEVIHDKNFSDMDDSK